MFQVNTRVLLLLAFVVIPASAQLDRATLAGSISDISGAVVAGATVDLLSQETGLRRELQTGPNGAYTFSLVPIGIYTVTANHPGFRPVAIKDVRLGVGDNRTVNIEMEVSTIETKVTVESIIAPLESSSAVVVLDIDVNPAV